MNSTPSSASSIFALVFGPVWPAYPATSPERSVSIRCPFFEHAHRGKDLADDARDGRLAGARVAGEDHVQAHLGVGQPGLAAPLLQLQIIRQRADFLLDRARARSAHRVPSAPAVGQAVPDEHRSVDVAFSRSPRRQAASSCERSPRPAASSRSPCRWSRSMSLRLSGLSIALGRR